jgi:hypothetical protein
MQTQTILFIGATGGCTNACLVHAIRTGVRCIALVRTPSRLIEQLTKQGLPASTIETHLTCVPGNALTISDVKTALNIHDSLPDTIVSGLGSIGNLKWEFCQPLQVIYPENPTLCTDAAQVLVQALREIYSEQAAAFGERSSQTKPSLVFVSTTGVTRGPEDVPFAMRFMYHQALALPHKDKKDMEDVFRGDAEQEKESQRVFRTVSGIRPTLLGPYTGEIDVSLGKGLNTIKAGTERKPAVGYSIMRADVGHWMFVNLVKDGEAKKRWEGEMVSLTS